MDVKSSYGDLKCRSYHAVNLFSPAEKLRISIKRSMDFCSVLELAHSGQMRK